MPSAYSQTEFYTGTNGGLWSVAANWQDNYVPTGTTGVYLGNGGGFKEVLVNAPGAQASFISMLTSRLVVGPGGGLTAGSASLGGAVNSGATIWVFGGTLTLTSGISISSQTNSASTMIVSGSNGSDGLYSSSASISLGSYGQAGTSGRLEIREGGTVQAAAIAAKPSESILTFSGGTLRGTRNTGELIGGLAYGDLRLSGTTNSSIEITGTKTNAINSSITGSGGLVKVGTGTLYLSSSNAYTGTTTVNAGTLISGTTRGFVTGSVAYVVNAGRLDMNGYDLTVMSLAGSGGVVNLSGTAGDGLLTVNQDVDTTFGGLISGSGGLLKSGTGVLTINGANTFTGTTTINGGIVALGSSSGLASALSFNSGTLRSAVANLSLNTDMVTNTGGANLDLTSGTLAIGGVISGSGGITKTGVGTLRLTGVNTFSGNLNINAGVLNMDNDQSFGAFSSFTVFDSGTFRTANGNFSHRMTVGNGGMTWDVTSGTALNSSTVNGTGVLTKIGQGMLMLTGGATSYNGLIVNEGSLFVSAASGLGNNAGIFTINGGTFQTANGFGLNRAITIGASGAEFRPTLSTLDL